MVEVSTGNYQAAAVKSDGTVWAWGNNGVGELGDGTTNNRDTPGPVNGFTNGKAIAVGISHMLALRQDGTVWAWGSNENGQLGDGTTTERHLPVAVGGLTGVT